MMGKHSYDCQLNRKIKIHQNIFQNKKIISQKQSLSNLNKLTIAIILSFIDYHLKHNQQIQKSYQKPTIYTKIRGLRNIGNTCYMNSTLQCLLNLSQFNTQLISSEESLKQVDNAQKLSIAQQYIDLIKQFTKQSHYPIDPSRLKSIVGKKINKFQGYRQHDAQQFLTQFLQSINTETSRLKQKPIYKTLPNNPGKYLQKIEELSEQWWSYYRKRQDSIVCDNFQGQTMSIIECKQCHSKSVTFDNFLWLAVGIQKQSVDSIEVLIDKEYKRRSEISDYYCSNCQQLRDCYEQISVYRLPRYLLVQLKRFEQDYYSKNKINSQVKLCQQLNLKDTIHYKSRQVNTLYRINSMVNHFGSVHSGHYTANVYKQNRWHLLNDSSTSQQTKSNKYSRQVYLLFYERKE